MAALTTSEVKQDKRTLRATLSSLNEASLLLGTKTKFTELADLINKSIDQANRDLLGADELLERDR